MKKFLSLLLVIGIALAVPNKARSYDYQAAGAALIAVGIASAYYSNKLWLDYKKERSKLTQELSNHYFNYNNACDRQKKNFLRMTASFIAGFTSISSTLAGLSLCNDSKITGATLIANGLAGAHYTKKLWDYAKKEHEKKPKNLTTKAEDPHKDISWMTGTIFAGVTSFSAAATGLTVLALSNK